MKRSVMESVGNIYFLFDIKNLKIIKKVFLTCLTMINIWKMFIRSIIYQIVRIFLPLICFVLWFLFWKNTDSIFSFLEKYFNLNL
jgi:hypothetical protein